MTSTTAATEREQHLAAEHDRLTAGIADTARLPHDHARLREELRLVEAEQAWLRQDRAFEIARQRNAVEYWQARDSAEEALRELLAAGQNIAAATARRNMARRNSGLPATPMGNHPEMDPAAAVLAVASAVVETLRPTPWPNLLQHIDAISRDAVGVPARPPRSTNP